MNDSCLTTLARQGKFEFPNQYVIDEMDLIDLRRKILKWCAKSQGAIGPCRDCRAKCSAGIRAIALYDGDEATRASEPEVVKPVIKEEKKVPVEIKEEVVKMKDRKKGRPVSKWYTDAMASGDAVKWCVDNLGITIQQAKKRIYMYEYNRFGARRTKPAETVEIKTVSESVAKTPADDFSLVSAMETKMKVLTERQQSYKVQIDELTAEYKKITDQLEAITMCIELLNEKTVS